MGYQASGWDPVHASTESRQKACVVNLGFVLNVIEDPVERIDTLVAAWSLAEDTLIVSTLVEGQEAYSGFTRNMNDGIVTARSTFQKYFGQVELQMLIEEALHVDADAIGLGIFVVFRSLQARQAFLFSRIQRDIQTTSVHRRIIRPASVRRPRPGFAEIYAAHQSMLDAFWLRYATLGRIPLAGEFEGMEELVREVGKPSKVARLLSDHFGSDVIDEARKERSDDLLVYLALAQFRRAIPLRDLPESLRSDIKTFFGSYQEAQQRAKSLLHSAGQTEVVSQACEALTFGWHTDDHYTIHRSLLDLLPPVLRVYVHCSSVIYGNPRDADLIKIHKHSGKVTLQFYTDFDGQMLPELRLRVKVNLRSLRVQIFDHSGPPFRQMMPFKERFLGPEAPGRANIEKFSRKLRRIGLTPEGTENGVSPEVMAAALKRFTRG
jgi:DNA phosphorothioation-associated putative methyltransferase